MVSYQSTHELARTPRKDGETMQIKVLLTLFRYHNHLDGSIRALDWGLAEEDVLFRLHGEVGNKWSLIAQQLPGRYSSCNKGLITV